MLGEFYLDGEPVPPGTLLKLGVLRAGFKPAGEFGREEGVTGKTTVLAYGGRSVLIPCGFELPFVRTDRGGLRLPDDSEFNGAEEPPGGFIKKQVVAVQYIGTGVRRYLYHLKGRNGIGDTLPPGETEIRYPGIDSAQSPVRFVQSDRYAGRSGIFLDQVHQPVFRATPTGGQFTAPGAVVVDRYLLGSGAELSGIMIGSLKILTKARLDEVLGRDSGMVAPELNVGCRVIFDDTMRLDQIAPERAGTRRDWAPEYRRYIRERYGSDDPAALRSHLREVGRIFGHNLKILFAAELTTERVQVSMNNFSSYGRLIDTESFRRWVNPIDFAVVTHQWLRDLRELIRRTAPDADAEAQAGPFLTLFRTIFGNDSVELPESIGKRGGISKTAAYLTASLVNGWLEMEGLAFDGAKILEAFERYRRPDGSPDPHAKALAAAVREKPWIEQQHIYLTALSEHFGALGAHEPGEPLIDILEPLPAKPERYSPPS